MAVVLDRTREVLVFEVGGQRYGLPSADPSDHFIVASAGPRGVILRVDRATHLALVDEASIQPAESLGPGAVHLAGVAKLEDGLVLIHDRPYA